MPPIIKRSFPVLALSIFAFILGVGIIGPLLPLYAETIGATGIWLGIIFGGFSVSRAIVMPFAGRLSDRWGRKLFLGTGLFTYAVLSFGYIWANDVAALALVRFLHGISAGMILPIAQAYVGDISPQGEEGRWMGYFNATFFMGFGTGPLMGGFLTDLFGFPATFSIMGGLNFLAFLGVAVFLPEVKHREVLASHQSSLTRIAASRMVRGLFTFRVAFSIGRGTFATFLPIFAGLYLGLSPSHIGVLVATNILLMALLQIYGGQLADRYSRRALVILGGMINIAFMMLIPFSANFWQLLGVCVLGGVGGALSMPAASALIVEEGRRLGMGMAMAIFAMAFSIGMAVGPVLAGIVADLATIGVVFYFGAGVGLLGIILFVWFTR